MTMRKIAYFLYALDDKEAIDVYNTILTAMGAKDRLGPNKRDHRSIDGIRA